MEMHACFAVKTGRPFQYVSEIDSTGGGDPRYAKGNHPVAFRDAREFGSMQKMMSAISSDVHSGHFRMAGEVENGDTYPVDVTQSTVKPGTIFYDPNGHVLLVYKVDPSGTIHLIDGHPDNSLTFGIFSEKYAGRRQDAGRRLPALSPALVRRVALPARDERASHDGERRLLRHCAVRSWSVVLRMGA